MANIHSITVNLLNAGDVFRPHKSAEVPQANIHITVFVLWPKVNNKFVMSTQGTFPSRANAKTFNKAKHKHIRQFTPQ